MELLLILLVCITILFILNRLRSRYFVDQTGGAEEESSITPSAQEEAVSRNVQIVIPEKKFTVSGIITSWRFVAVKQGIIHFQLFRPVSANTYRLVGENSYEIRELGENIYSVLSSKQLVFQPGDTIGIRYNDTDLVRYTSDSGSVLIHNISGPVGVGMVTSFSEPVTRNYDVNISYDEIFVPPRGTIGSSENLAAPSAQSIVEHYKKGSKYPKDGTYWIKSKLMKNAEQVYCNFSLRKGSGYMLVGSVSPTGGWPDFDSGNYPFNPHLSHGTYDPYGRMTSYYMEWAKLDPSAVLDQDPVSCHKGNFTYNNDGKFCSKDGERVRLKDGLTEIMFVTGNQKYWVVVDRATIEKPLEKGRAVRIDPIDSSKNFAGKCDSNKYIYLLGKGQKGDPWVNMGDSHACGSNYMFWGEDGAESNIKFKNENKGVQIYVGGQYPGSVTKDFPHNPTHHRAPGKGRYQSTFKEAEQVCMSLGKKVCSVPQLDDANKAGYGNCDCGWTSTKKDKDHLVIAYPTNVDIWGELQFDPKKKSWCGVPGMNTCGVVTDTGGVNGHMGADIYCCDKYDFDKGFKGLEIPYSLGMVWVTELEQQFRQTYSVNIPTGTKFVVFNDKYGLALKKTDSDKYELTSHPKGRAPKEGVVKAQIPPGAMDVNPSTHAVFLDDLPSFDIKAGTSWTPARGSDGQVSYGSRFKIRGSRYLTGFPELKKEGLSQVYGIAEPTSDSPWVIQPVDAEHGLVRSGDTVKLEHVTSKQHLASNPVHATSSEQRVYMDTVVDSDDFWRIELSPGDHYLKSSSKFRLVHVNTNKVLDISQRIVNGKMLIVATSRRTPGSLLTLESLEAVPIPHDKCEEYLNKIIKTRQLLQSGHPMTADLYRSASTLRDSYNSECYKISMKAYEMGINPKIEQVRKEMDELNRQLGIYEKYHNDESELVQTQSRTIAQQEEQEAELTKLLNKHCLPVKQCVVPPDLKKDVSPTCRSLNGLMRSHEITDDLIHEIQKIRRGNDSIANYDIRNHRDYYKLSKAAHVEPC